MKTHIAFALLLLAALLFLLPAQTQELREDRMWSLELFEDGEPVEVYFVPRTIIVRSEPRTITTTSRTWDTVERLQEMFPRFGRIVDFDAQLYGILLPQTGNECVVIWYGSALPDATGDAQKAEMFECFND